VKNLTIHSSLANPDRAGLATPPPCRRHIHRFTALLVLLFWTQLVASREVLQDCGTAQHNSRLVIIIDDMGHNLARGRDALSLPGKLNFAVIPYTRYGAELAQSAHQNGKEVLVHVPMSTEEPVPLGKGGLTAQLSRKEFRETLSAALGQIPHAQGINNHMGSGLTQKRLQMSWLMQELRKREMYFVDSRTSQNTIAATVAGEFNVPHLSRHVFLDNDRNVKEIDARFKETLLLAQRYGIAVAIGHPYPETINYLRDALLTVHDMGIHPVFVSEVLSDGDGDGDGETPTAEMTDILVGEKAAEGC
jgi:polysaccharide deacetylase 2 family uncharacterized protein YibQ